MDSFNRMPFSNGQQVWSTTWQNLNYFDWNQPRGWQVARILHRQQYKLSSSRCTWNRAMTYSKRWGLGASYNNMNCACCTRQNQASESSKSDECRTGSLPTTSDDLLNFLFRTDPEMTATSHHNEAWSQLAGKELIDARSLSLEPQYVKEMPQALQQDYLLSGKKRRLPCNREISSRRFRRSRRASQREIAEVEFNDAGLTLHYNLERRWPHFLVVFQLRFFKVFHIWNFNHIFY